MKVLVISHNAFSTTQSMGKTFLTLFSSFDPSELCQLYIYPTIPEKMFCSSYYRITDKEVLKSLVSLRTPGAMIDPQTVGSSEHVLYENASDETFYKQSGNQAAGKRLLRDVMWKFSRWYSKPLREWLAHEKPTCIFVAPGYGKFVYDFALKISSKLHIPIVTYVCDDYYFVKPSPSLVGRMQLKQLCRKTDVLMKRSTHLVTICDELRDTYSRHFQIPATVLMTGASCQPVPFQDTPCDTLSYFGNIGCHREQSLAAVGRALDDINREHGTAYKLEIYTGTRDPEILKKLDGIACLEMRGFVSGEAFQKAFSAARLLLHVEAFDEKSRDQVKYSVSTKIADCLCAGVPLLAYAPAEVASMQHLMRHNCAFTASDEETLKTVLLKAFTDIEARRHVVENACQTAKNCHDATQNSRRLYELLSSL